MSALGYIVINILTKEGGDHFIIGGGGWKTFFGRLFFSVDVKGGFFLHTPFEARFFLSQRIEGQLFFFNNRAWYRQLFLPLCRSDRLFFLQHMKAKKFFHHTGSAEFFFFSQKQRQIIFFKESSSPPPSR